jgi:hypothetical protein
VIDLSVAEVLAPGQPTREEAKVVRKSRHVDLFYFAPPVFAGYPKGRYVLN